MLSKQPGWQRMKAKASLHKTYKLTDKPMKSIMTTNIVNLQEIASQLEQTAKSIEEKVKGTDTRFNITVGMLVKKVPTLKVLGNSTSVFQARWSEEGLKIDIPRVCKSIETEQVITQLPDLEVLPNVEYIRYVTGLGGYAVVKIGNQEFQIGLIPNLDLETDFMEGKGIPPIEILGYEKRPEIPLKSDSIPLNQELIVVGNGKKSREYGTAMCDVKIASTGEVIKNVLCNTQLERLIEKYGKDGQCRFKVTKKTATKNGNTRVSILDLNGVDFTDLEV